LDIVPGHSPLNYYFHPSFSFLFKKLKYSRHHAKNASVRMQMLIERRCLNDE